MTYIHELPGWPQFRWDSAAVAAPLAAVSRHQGRLLGRMEALGFDLRSEAQLESLTEEIVKSSEIEGEQLDRSQVRSSVARRLGIGDAALGPADRDIEGVVAMMLDATEHYADKVTPERLFGWHAALFPTGYSGLHKITVGAWRTDADGPMQVVSGPEGKQWVHFQAPAAPLLPDEMQNFLDWLNSDPQSEDLVLKAAIAHLWFVTIHPFDDGNGRMARALTDLVLARSERTRQRFYSMSSQIRKDRDAYYNVLEATQKGDLDITEWVVWFLKCLDHAFDGAETTLATVLRKASFWEANSKQSINPRQRLVLNKLLDGFEGKLTNSKWATLAKTSNDTALRDIDDLVKKGMLEKDSAGGRSTSYSLVR